MSGGVVSVVLAVKCAVSERRRTSGAAVASWCASTTSHRPPRLISVQGEEVPSDDELMVKLSQLLDRDPAIFLERCSLPFHLNPAIDDERACGVCSYGAVLATVTPPLHTWLWCQNLRAGFIGWNTASVGQEELGYFDAFHDDYEVGWHLRRLRGPPASPASPAQGSQVAPPAPPTSSAQARPPCMPCRRAMQRSAGNAGYSAGVVGWHGGV